MSNNSEIDNLLGEFLNIHIGDQPKPVSNINQNDHGTYQLPVRTGKTGTENEKPWIVGTFIPNQYVNDTHPQGHNGVDLKAARGTPIYPIGPGVVIETSNTPKGGNNLKISHENGIVISYYAHLDSIKVSKGDQVDFNTIIGNMGDTGNAKGRGAHLHYEVSVNNTKINPFNITGKTIGSFSKKAYNEFINILNKYAKI